MGRRNKYFGITHPIIDLEKWKEEHCSENEHVFDEIFGGGYGHALVCDACGLAVYIKSIKTEEEVLEEINKELNQ